MGLTINTNLEAIDAGRNLNATEGMLSQAMERLSSGLRINSAADDVAGYAISESLQSQTNGLNQAAENIQDAVALAQTAQGALNDVNQMLQRIRELGVEYLNGTTSEEGKTAIENEMEQLFSEIKRVGETTEFNGTKLLEGKEGASVTIEFQVGPNDKETISVESVELFETDIKGTIGEKASELTEKLKAEGEENGLEKLTEAIGKVSESAGTFGAVQDRIQYTLSNLEVYSENLTAADSALSDVNMATEMTNFTKDEVLQQAGVAILAQANQLPDAALKLLE